MSYHLVELHNYLCMDLLSPLSMFKPTGWLTAYDSCGHGAVDDPDASIIYDETMQLLEKEEYAHWANDIIVMRIGPSDQSKSTLPPYPRETH